MADIERNMLSKEAVASRMFRNAAKQWGYTDTTIDNFDPLVRLLIEACASEIYKLGNEIESVQERVIEKLASILTPQVYVMPKPAHGILHGRSSDMESYLSRNMQFFFQKKVASKPNGPLDSNIDIYFSPSGSFKIIDGDIKFVASGNNFYNISDGSGNRELLAKSTKALPYRTVWAGLEIANGIEDITQLSLFMDLRNTPEKRRFLSLISFLQCSINNIPISFDKGLPRITGDETDFQYTLEELYLNNRIEYLTDLYYKDQFLTINSQNPALKKINSANLKMKYPGEFEELLNPKELAKFTKDLIWLKFTFRPEFTAEILDDLTISINCFPIINRHLNEITYRLQNYFNIIPLSSDEQFLSVNKVESTSDAAKGDKEYKQYSFDQFDNTIKGTYTVRNGDMERFDSRNATEYMNYLTELLRDESRAFAALGQDFISSQIKALNQVISQIEQRLKQNSSVSNSPAYLLINPIAEGDTIFASYWTSNGEVGNNVRSGSKMELYEGSMIKKESIGLLTNTIGGAERLKNTDTLAAYKNVMLTRGRIVTQADIKSYCQYYLQDKTNLERIDVQRGVGVSVKPTEGLIPTVDIIIKTKKNDQLSTEEWDAVKYELLMNLEEQSAVNLNYRIFVN